MTALLATCEESFWTQISDASVGGGIAIAAVVVAIAVVVIKALFD